MSQTSSSRVGRFELEEMVGDGPNGSVWRGKEDLGLDHTRIAAVKFLPGGRLNDKKWIARFEKEARYLMQFSEHRNIVKVLGFDVDPHRGPWFAMEYLPNNLGKVITDGPASPEVVRQMLVEVAHGLQAIHSASEPLLHLDIKPSNILQDSEGIFKISDFGCARPQVKDATLGSVSFKYAAPELQGAALGEQRASADLYSLGFCAFELACGNTLFRQAVPKVYGGGGYITRVTEAQERAGWVSWHADLKQAMPPIEQILPDMPRDLAAVINKLILKDPTARYQSADEILHDLRAGAGSAGSAAKRVTTYESPRNDGPKQAVTMRRLLPWIGGGVAAALLIGGGAYFYLEQSEYNAAKLAFDRARAKYGEKQLQWDGFKFTESFDHKKSKALAADAQKMVALKAASTAASLLKVAQHYVKATDILEDALAMAQKEELDGTNLKVRTEGAKAEVERNKHEFAEARAAWEKVKLVEGRDHKESKALAGKAAESEPKSIVETLEGLIAARDAYYDGASKYRDAIAKADRENRQGTGGDPGDDVPLTPEQQAMLELFLKNGDYKKIDMDGKTPLQIASARGEIDKVRALLMAGAEIDKADRFGMTALHEAARNGRLEVVKQLLRYKPQLDEGDKQEGFSPIFKAIQGGHLDIVEALIKAKADVKKLNNYGNTPLHYAVERNFAAGASALIAAGADVNAARKTDRYTPLHQAAWSGTSDIAKLLLEKGAQVEAKTTTNDTALHIAARSDKVDVVKVLVEGGASLNARNRQDKTPEDVAGTESRAYFAGRATRH